MAEEFWNAALHMEDPKQKIVYLPLEKLHPFAGHPYKVQDDAEMNELIDSIQTQGILSPLIVRSLEGSADEYEIVSGHRRFRAAQKAGLEEVPAFVFAIDRDAAAIAVVDSNLHREHILPSEKAFAYKLKMEAMKHQGTSGQLGRKWSRDEISDTESGRTVQRYIRLTNLIPELLQKMDEGRIAFSVGVELSFLSVPEQKTLLTVMDEQDCTPSFSQSCRLHKLSVGGRLDGTAIISIMEEEKANQKERVSLRMEDISRFFPEGYTAREAEEEIIRLLRKEYERRHGRDAK